ncbi:TRY1 protein, partial [Arenaria interpres]|nr:TRY1 protein [Arenaria interpres]
RAGEHSLAEMTGQEQFSMAVDMVVHPGFDPGDGDGSYAHDLMLLRLDPPFKVTPYVQPLALPRSPPATGATCTVMGWGTTTSPQGMEGPRSLGWG